VKEDILFLNTNLIELALNNLVNQKNFPRKILWRERFFSCQIGDSAKGQKDTEEKGEEVTDPTP
jgi:hypothetical protein